MFSNSFYDSIFNKLNHAAVMNDVELLVKALDINKAFVSIDNEEFIINKMYSCYTDETKLPKTGITIAHVAAYYDSYEILETLLSLKSFESQKACLTVDIESADGYHPLHYAVANGSLECVYSLLIKGANPNYVPQNSVLLFLFVIPLYI